jgi:hypothetical protein
MGKGMCKFRSCLLEIEYSNKKRDFFCFYNFFMCIFFCQFLLCITYFSFFSTNIVHNLTFSFDVTYLLAKLSFSRKLCNSKKQLYYVTIGEIL